MVIVLRWTAVVEPFEPGLDLDPALVEFDRQGLSE
jgi:hypothetical protein